MTLIEALRANKRVCIMFVNVKKDMQWSITFTKEIDLAYFFNPIVGELEDVGEATNEKPFEYFKALFVSEEAPEEDIWESDEPCGYA